MHRVAGYGEEASNSGFTLFPAAEMIERKGVKQPADPGPRKDREGEAHLSVSFLEQQSAVFQDILFPIPAEYQPVSHEPTFSGNHRLV